MKIALITNFPLTSGMGKYAYALYAYLNEHGIQADLISLNPFKGFKQVGDGKIIVINEKISRLNTLKNYLLNPHRISRGYDVYHITNEWLGIYAKYNKPSIVTFHDVFLKGPGSEYTRGLPSAPKLLTKRLEWSRFYHWFGDRSKMASKFANRIICNSEFTRRNVLEVLGIEQSRVKVAYGITSAIFKPRDKIKAREKLKLPLDSKIVLSVGSEDTPVKNILNVVMAFHRLKRKLNDVLLIRVGNSSKKTLALIKKLEIERSIIHMKNLSEEELALVYNASDALCFPVLYAGFGMPVIEAMASGCPVVASNYASLPEVAKDAGLLVDPLDVDQIASALTSILSDEQMRIKLIRRGLKQVKERFSMDKWCQETLSLYEEALNNI